MTLQDVLAAIDKEPNRFSIMSDADLDRWAQYAVGVFNEPAPADTTQIVEIIGRKLAAALRQQIGESLVPSVARLVGAFKRVAPNEPDEMYRQLSMWCELVCVYLSDCGLAGKP